MLCLQSGRSSQKSCCNRSLPGAEIWLDGKKVGKTPEPLSMAGGNYEFVLKRPRYKDEELKVSARRGEQYQPGHREHAFF